MIETRVTSATGVIDQSAARRQAILAGSVCLAFLFCYAPVLTTLSSQWLSDPMYAHGILIPVISAYVAWQRRSYLATEALTPMPFAGGALLLVGLSLMVTGTGAAIVAIQEISILPTLAGLVMMLFGRRALRVLWFPIAFLTFMMPVWDIVAERLHDPLQQFTAMVAAKMLSTIGIPVFRDETYLYLPTVTLQVARVCSGINYLVAVIAIAVPAAYLTFRDLPRRFAIAAFATLVAIVANPIRVTLIGLSAHYGMSQDIHGPGHVLHGLFVSFSGFVAIIAGIGLLRRIALDSPTEASAGQAPAAQREAIPFQLSTRKISATLAANALLVLSGSLTLVAGEPFASTDAVDLGFPDQIGHWRLVQQSELPPLAFLPSDRPGRWRTYRNDAGEEVQLHVGSALVHYWDGADIVKTDRVQMHATSFGLLTPSGEVTIQGARGIVSGGDAVVGYWYDVGDRVVTNRVTAKLMSVGGWLSGTYQRPRILILAARTEDSQKQATAVVTAFGQELAKVLYPTELE